MRDTGRATALLAAAAAAGVELDVRTLDVTDPAGAASCVEEVLRDHGRIDVLVNNAGRGCVGTAEQLGMDTVRDQLEVNYLGVVALTKLVLPGMRERRHGRVVTVTSVGGAVGQPFADAYCGAKFAVEGFMQSLAVVAERFGVWVSVIEPAAVASDFVANVQRPAAGDDPYAEAVRRLPRPHLGRVRQRPERGGCRCGDRGLCHRHVLRVPVADLRGATAFVGMSLADLDGERVLGATRTWIA